MSAIDSVHRSAHGDRTNSASDPTDGLHPSSFEGKLLLTSLQVHLDEISRLAAVASDAFGRLAAGGDAQAVLADEVRRLIPRWHFPMLNDHERNDALGVALERQIRPGSRVLDIGSGTGLLAMMAIRAGAGSVLTCETSPVMAQVARDVVAQHGMSKEITVVSKRSTDLVIGRDLDAPVDFLISEIVDCGLIGEGLLATISHAREHLLAPNGGMLPRSAKLFGFLIDSTVVANLNQAKTAGGFDVRRLNAVATQGHFPVRLGTWPHRVITDTVELISFDLVNGPLSDGSSHISLPVTCTGTAHALVVWFEMDLGANVVVRNSPDNVGSHWMQALVPFTQPVELHEGDRAAMTLRWQDSRLTATVHTTLAGGLT